MTLDSECPVAISSLGEGECQQPPTTEPTTKPSTTDNTAAIIGGVVAVILIIAFAVVAIIMTEKSLWKCVYQQTKRVSYAVIHAQIYTIISSSTHQQAYVLLHIIYAVQTISSSPLYIHILQECGGSVNVCS